jgi:hypothetical protein
METDTTKENDGGDDDDGGVPEKYEDLPPKIPEDKKSFRRQFIEPLDFAPASGAVDEVHAAQDMDTGYYTGRHAYTENATFTNEDIPSTWSNSPRDSLNELNRNFYANEDKSVSSEQHKLDEQNDAKAWAKRVGLTEVEGKRAAYLTTKVEANAKKQYTATAVILAAITIAANEPVVQRRVVRSTVPDLEDINTSFVEDYEQLREDLGVETLTVRRAREAIRENM